MKFSTSFEVGRHNLPIIQHISYASTHSIILYTRPSVRYSNFIIMKMKYDYKTTVAWYTQDIEKSCT